MIFVQELSRRCAFSSSLFSSPHQNQLLSFLLACNQKSRPHVLHFLVGVAANPIENKRIIIIISNYRQQNYHQQLEFPINNTNHHLFTRLSPYIKINHGHHLIHLPSLINNKSPLPPPTIPNSFSIEPNLNLHSTHHSHCHTTLNFHHYCHCHCCDHPYSFQFNLT